MNGLQVNEDEPKIFEQPIKINFGSKNQVLNQQLPIKMNGPQVNEDEAKKFEHKFNYAM